MGKREFFDTGIREVSIIGQGIGLALRGLRPIAEIQYLDYLLFGLEPLSDDVCTTHFAQKASTVFHLLYARVDTDLKVSGIVAPLWE